MVVDSHDVVKPKDSETGKLLADVAIIRPAKMSSIPAPVLSFLASLSYGIASLAMVFFNKAVLLQYPYSMTLLTLQQAAASMLIYFGGEFGWINVRKLDWKTSRRLLPLSLFYNANVAFALASLKGINIPMYIALKRLTPMAVLITAFFRGKSRPSFKVSASVILLGCGVIIAALGDFSFDPSGYAMALTSVVFQTAYLVLVERSGAEDGLSSTDLMLYNAALSLPFLLLLIVVTGEATVAFPSLVVKLASFDLCITIVLSLLMGLVLNFTMFLCTIVNSALTTTIVGVLKGVGSMVLGFFLLGGVEIHALNVTGLMVNTLGGIWYSYAKFTEKSQKRAHKGPSTSEQLLPLSSKHLN